MKYEDVKRQLEEIMKIDFNVIKEEDLENIINDLFILYKGFINESCDIRSKNPIFINSIFAPPGKNLALEGKMNIDEIKTRLQKDKSISYAYGAYISNRIAHLFDMVDGIDLGRNPIDNSTITFSDEFNSRNNKKNLQKRAFALKTMFTQMIIEQSKNNNRCNITWDEDEKGKTILNINITNYSIKKMQEYSKYPEDIIISIHVIDTELSDTLQTLFENDVSRASRPLEILNGEIYKELQEEEK